MQKQRVETKKFFQRIVVLFAVVGALLTAPTGAWAAGSWDVANDVSTTNPHGVWSYGYTAIRGSAFNLLPTHVIVNPLIDAWTRGGVEPVVINNHSSVPFKPACCNPIPAGTVAVHPGSGGENAVIRWSAPGTGTYSVIASFTGRDTAGTSTDVAVLHNGVSLFVGEVTGYLATRSFSKSVTMQAGDTIDFTVGFGTDGNYISDTTGVAITINGVAAADSMPPTVAATASPAPNAAGWSNGLVTVSFTCTDAGSGVNLAASNLANVVLTASGTATGTCVDTAGNSATASYTAKIDMVPPTITASASPAPNAAGWNNAPVTVSFACTDAGSGVNLATSNLGDQVLNASGSATGTCVDNAGNSASASYAAKIDMVPPTIAFAGNQGSYGLLDTVAITCAASDDNSGVATDPCTGFQIADPAWTFAPTNMLPSPGLVATDNAGNASNATSTNFTVSATADSLCTLGRQLVVAPGRKGDHEEAHADGRGGPAGELCNILREFQRAAAKGESHEQSDTLREYDSTLAHFVQRGWLTQAQAGALAGWAGTL